MNKAVSLGLSFIGTLLVLSLEGWGSNVLPQLATSTYLPPSIPRTIDSIPAKAQTPQPEQQSTQQTGQTVTPPVVKEVPKSRRKVKPSTVHRRVNIPPAKIIKPNVFIKKINVKVP